uniref:Uncharacterized protein n=1 Tax=Meloidogyne enterolobii TaxID=390850 RepID=A0A6V7XLQ9_MELEN|nr:unnamed protein product [Meloidogyne enterolobii]
MCHSKELAELSRMTPKLIRGLNCGPRYRSQKSKTIGGTKHFFGGEKFGYANYTSFERARRAESNDTKITVIEQD